MENFLPYSRDVRKHWVYKDSQYFHVWSEMLLTAKYTETSKETVAGQTVDLAYGEFIFGRKEYSDRIGISEQRLRTLIKKMIDDGMIKLIKNYNKFSVFCILNYSKFNYRSNQQSNQQSNATSTSRATSKTPVIPTVSEEMQPAEQRHINQQSNTESTTYKKLDNSTTSTTATGQSVLTIMDAYTLVTRNLMMDGLISEFVLDVKRKGFNDKFIIELLLEAGETSTKGISDRYLRSIFERWVKDGIYSREESKAHKEANHPSSGPSMVGKTGEAHRSRLTKWQKSREEFLRGGSNDEAR